MDNAMFTLPSLQYEHSSLEPYIVKETMVEHHTFHHQSYVSNLNAFLGKIGYKGECLLELLTKTIHDQSIDGSIRDGIRNHAGGHYNHSLFWLLMSKESRLGDMCDTLSGMIARDFQSVEGFKAEFNRSALRVFGSGWAWLVRNKKSDKLEIVTTLNQNTPFSGDTDKIPVLGLDVWEHAYYLQYKHARSEYVERWWNVVDWKGVSRLFETYAMKGELIHVKSDGTVD